VLSFDARTLPNDLSKPSPSLFTLQAHDGAVAALDINPHIRGCLLTGGTDKLVKVWNLSGGEDGTKRQVSLVTSRDLGVVRFLSFFSPTANVGSNCVQGKVFSAVFSPDDPLILTAAGSSAKVQVWDVGANMGVRKAFGSKLREAGKIIQERERGGGGVIGVASDGEESEDEE
jgi:periodic tryptophan protein 1